jgi:hypothetical protein
LLKISWELVVAVPNKAPQENFPVLVGNGDPNLPVRGSKLAFGHDQRGIAVDPRDG